LEVTKSETTKRIGEMICRKVGEAYIHVNLTLARKKIIEGGKKKAMESLIILNPN